MGKPSPEETQTSNIVKCIGQIGGFGTGGEAMTLWGTHSEHSSLVRSNDSEICRGGNKMPDGISLQPLNNAFLVSVIQGTVGTTGIGSSYLKRILRAGDEAQLGDDVYGTHKAAGLIPAPYNLAMVA